MTFNKYMICLALLAVCSILPGCTTFTFNTTDREISYVQEYLKEYPQNQYKHVYLASLYWEKYTKTGNQSFLDKAETESREAIRLDPDYIGGHFSLAYTFLKQGKTELALSKAQESLKLNSTCYLNRYLLGEIYSARACQDACCNSDIIELGVKELKESIRLNPQDSYSHNLLGTLYRLKGLYDETLLSKIT